MVDHFYMGIGNAGSVLSEDQIRTVIQNSLQQWSFAGKKILVILPDHTRTAPVPLIFRTLVETLGETCAKLDFLSALGTHPVMSHDSLCKLVGITPEEHAQKYDRIGLYCHRWDLAETFINLGTITAEETRQYSRDMLSLDVPVRVNRMVIEYDVILVYSPVFPHEVAGFSGGKKYFFPGISGPEVINFTHWLGALITSFKTIGVEDTPVRQVINRASGTIPTPVIYLCSAGKTEGLYGIFISEGDAAWNAAVKLSSQIHIRYLDHPYRVVFSEMPAMYDDLWTGAKGMYKLEPVVADGGEVIIFAPRITEISYTHGKIIDEVGYHVRDYFVKQWDRFKGYPWGVLAHSTHLRGMGTYENGVENARILVSLSTGIPAKRCQKVNLGYRDPAGLKPEEWREKEVSSVLYVPHAGEVLYRLRDDHI